MNEDQDKQLAKLRVPFPDNLVSRLDRGKGVVLSYVGHAALTHRLLDVDPFWNWEPLAWKDGLPLFDETGGLWIRLTVCGCTRLGYGNAGKKGNPGDREKEVIGDALRNAAMRFGAALDLWHKGDLYGDSDSVDGESSGTYAPRVAPQETIKARATELLKLMGMASTQADIDAVMADVKAEKDDLKTVENFVAAMTAQKKSAELRIGGAADAATAKAPSGIRPDDVRPVHPGAGAMISGDIPY